MTAEKLHDAITLLPHDLIAETDQLRCRPMKPALNWQRWAAMAACLLLVLSCTLVFQRKILPGMGGIKESTTQIALPMAPETQVPGADNAPAEDFAAVEESAMEDAAPRLDAAGEPMLRNPVTTAPPVLTLVWEGGSAELQSGNYTLTFPNDDGTETVVHADGAYPPDAKLEPHAVSHPQIALQWEQEPDSVTLRSWNSAGEEAEEGAGPRIDGHLLTVIPSRTIYEITAVWADLGTASYAVCLVLEA